MPASKPNIIQDLKVNRLPTLPTVLVEMLRACENNQTSFQELSSIISRDSVIAGRVIVLANSAFYNPGSKINSLERALFILGIDTLKTLVITAALQQFFSSFKCAHSEFLIPFWERSLTCALLAKSLAILTSYPDPDEAYLTGLLHNIGELVLESNHPGFYSDARKSHSAHQHADLQQIENEKSRFSFDHTQVGACLVNAWGMSQIISDALEFHHADPQQMEDAHHLVKIIFLASYLSHKDKHFLSAHDDIAHRLFELNAALVNEIVIKIDSEVSEISHSLGITQHQDAITHQEKAQLNLASQVRDISLIQNAMGEMNRANNISELGNSLQNSMLWLYGFDKTAVFWFQSETNELHFEHPESTTLPIKINIEAQRNIIAKSAVKRTIMSSLDLNEHGQTGLSVVDAQLTNLFQSRGFVCIPLADQHGLICVLLAGINEPMSGHIKLRRFINHFAHEAALTCRRSLAQFESLNTASHTPYPDSHRQDTLNSLKTRLDEAIHEANNPLNIINNYLHSLGQRINQNESADSQEINREINILKEEVLRTSQILLQLKDLNEDSDAARLGVDLNNEIQSLCTIFKNSLFLIKNIECKLELDPHLKNAFINRNAFKQILTNLLRNAVEALPSQGKIRISTNAHVNVNGQDFIEFSVADNGPGIPQDIIKNIFKPVVSTKGKGHSGLGLSITKNLVKDAKGTISCRSSEKGTVIQVLFPQKM